MATTEKKKTVAKSDISLVGKDIDAWCNKCKLMLAHVVVALKGGAPYKVQCNTCEANHVYRSGEPGTRKRASRKKAPKPTDWERAMAKQDEESAIKYATSASFGAGDLIEHKTLGLGLVTDLKGPGKIAVMFEGGDKVLMHER